MVARLLFISTLLFLIGCNTGTAKIKKSAVDSSISISDVKIINTNSYTTVKKTTVLKTRLKGSWTDSSSENAIFDINDTAFYYVNQSAYYPYDLIGDSITIKYSDYYYTARISFKNDTLIMTSKDYSEAKFWKFNK